MGIREMIFRGKRKDNGEWVYGFPFSYKVGFAIEGIETWDGERHRIDPSTVGQYTGLTDKNGKRIFEGDIVSTLGGKAFEVKFGLGSFFLNGTAITIHHAIRFTVVGNRWDNQELLEEVSE